MWDWISALFASWLGVSVPGSVIRDALVRVVNTLTSLFKPWVQAGANFANWFGHYVNRVWMLALALERFAQWLVFTALPRAVSQAFDSAVSWAAQQLQALRDFVTGWISTVERWVQQEFAALVATVTGWVNTIWGTLSTLYNDFQTVKARVVALLTNPQALADWIAGQIVAATGRWFLRNAATVARYLLVNAVPGTRQLADLLERVIVDMFL